MTNEERTFDFGFSPVIGAEPEILVLGSIPGKKSIEVVEYYGHPRNQFWWIMSELFGFSLALNYSHRVEQLIANRVALWDVVSRCERPGSLDASIVKDSVIANPIDQLLSETPSIRCLAFNGQKSFELYKKHISKTIQIRHEVLPSTSPANAAMTRDVKLQRWRAILQ